MPDNQLKQCALFRLLELSEKAVDGQYISAGTMSEAVMKTCNVLTNQLEKLAGDQAS